jgi:hypothetical protein
MHPGIKRAAPKALLAAIALVSLGGVLWMPTRPEEQDLDIVREREVREFIRELERDLLRNGQIELFNHVVFSETNAWDERADAVRHGLAELMKVQRLRFTNVQLAVTGTKALVQIVVSGYAPDAAGHLNPHTQSVLLRLEKLATGWKVIDIYPRPETH